MEVVADYGALWKAPAHYAAVACVLIHGECLDGLVELLAVDCEERFEILRRIAPVQIEGELRPCIDDKCGIAVVPLHCEFIDGADFWRIGLWCKGTQVRKELLVHRLDPVPGDSVPLCNSFYALVMTP